MKPITYATTPWRCGGLYALSRGTLICENVYNALDVYASAHVGAFVGRTLSDTAVTRFKNCVVAGTVSANNSNTSQNVGGFAASLGGAEVTFENCLVTGTVQQTNNAVDRAAGFVCQLSAKGTMTFKNNIFAGTVLMGSAKTGRYYAWSCDETKVTKDSVNNLYVPNPGTSINSGSPKVMPLVTVDENGAETVTFPEQTTPRYKVAASRLTGVGAAATLAAYGMTDWVATEGTPLPATIAAMLDVATTTLTKDTDSVADYLGYQTKVDEATATGAIRLVGHINSLDYEKVGVKYTLSYVDDAETADITATVDTDNVYTGLCGAETIYTNTEEDQPNKNEYFFLFTLENIKTDAGDVCVFVETFHIANGAEVAGETFCFFVDWS